MKGSQSGSWQEIKLQPPPLVLVLSELPVCSDEEIVLLISGSLDGDALAVVKPLVAETLVNVVLGPDESVALPDDRLGPQAAARRLTAIPRR